MADAIVTSLLGPILSKLSSQILLDVGLAWGLKTDLENLESTVGVIQAVLHDAEEKQWRSEAVKNWLRKLKDVAYDVDDVLEEFSIEAQRNRQQRDLKNKVRSFFSLDHNPLVLRVEMAYRLKNVKEKLDAIANERNKFDLTARVGDVAADSYNWRLTSSLVNESEICGRGKEREELINMLLSNPDDLSICAICGMGGLGKTTLAQLIYNDESVTSHFDLRIWLCVSVDFQVRRLTRAIIESIDGASCDIQELDPLQRCLQQKLSGKKFLLVLDDLWDDHDDTWCKLKEVLRCGAKGSAVLITTRIEMVASRMTATFVQHLGRLSEEESWLLFQRLALGMRRREDCTQMEAIGVSIVKKCGGVPLAIKALGNLMRQKESEGEWAAVKESEIWDLREKDIKILPALRLSYDNLSPHLKQCFAFCSIFPKDHVLVKEQLIALWIANGFVCCKGQIALHDMGNDIFTELVGRSFFQEVKDDGLGNITCKMHDLIHDLAQSVTSQECCLIEGNEPVEISKTIRHVAMYNRSPAPSGEKLIKNQSLHSFLMRDKEGNIRTDWFRTHYQQLASQKYIRALDLKACPLMDLPKFVFNLKHLRYLDVSGSLIETLPESITFLQNLQTLNLRHCWALLNLPKGMKLIKKLMYLDNTGCHMLSCMPPGMGELNCLRKLGKFIVGKDDGCHIGELEKLNLGGELSIEGLNNVKGLSDAKNANLMGKINLQSLRLQWQVNGVDRENHEEVLSSLQPYKNLKKLEIDGYMGSKFSNWIMNLNLLLPNLVEIELERCVNCEQLPSLGKLLHLKHLRLERIDGVKCIVSDVYGDDAENHPFPSLETLHLHSLVSLEQWEIVAGRQSFPRLHTITISSCPILAELPFMPSVKTLKILGGCSVTLLRSVRNLTSLVSLHIDRIPDLMLLPDGMLQNNTLLEYLALVLPNLKSLSNRILDNLSALKSLEIEDCRELESLSAEGLCNLNSLETLKIKNCNRLTSLPMSGLCGLSSLRSLDIDNCMALSCLSNQIEYLMSLSYLYICDCPNLMSFPDGMRNLEKLKFLYIHSCPSLERRCKKKGGEDFPKIAHIPTIIINDKVIQKSKA